MNKSKIAWSCLMLQVFFSGAAGLLFYFAEQGSSKFFSNSCSLRDNHWVVLYDPCICFRFPKIFPLLERGTERLMGQFGKYQLALIFLKYKDGQYNEIIK